MYRVATVNKAWMSVLAILTILMAIAIAGTACGNSQGEVGHPGPPLGHEVRPAHEEMPVHAARGVRKDPRAHEENRDHRGYLAARVVNSRASFPRKEMPLSPFLNQTQLLDQAYEFLMMRFLPLIRMFTTEKTAVFASQSKEWDWRLGH